MKPMLTPMSPGPLHRHKAHETFFSQRETVTVPPDTDPVKRTFADLLSDRPREGTAAAPGEDQVCLLELLQDRRPHRQAGWRMDR